MSHNMLHIAGPTRMDNVSTIVGDRHALLHLRAAIDDALASGSGGAATFCSDGEPHAVAVLMEADMYPVCTTYAGEPFPARSRRETTPIATLGHYAAAMRKAQQSTTAELAIGSP